MKIYILLFFSIIWGMQSLQAQDTDYLLKGLEGDLHLRIASGKASSQQLNNELAYSFDRKGETLYHSSWDTTCFPVELEYRLDKANRVDYIVYHPRSGGGNGAFREFELWVSTRKNPEFTKIGDYDFEGRETPSTLFLKHPVEHPVAFKFIVRSGVNHYVSCAEMEFMSRNKANSFPSTVFTDASCTALKQGIGEKDIKLIRNAFYRGLAEELLNNSVAAPFRVQDYEAYPIIGETSRKLKTGGYNPFENPMGIYFSAGEKIAVLVGDKAGKDISLRVHCFESDDDNTYILFPGLNVLEMKGKGLGYLNFYTADWKTAGPVKVQVIGGKVNGYFDKSLNNNEDWKRLLSNAVCGIMDIKGDYVNLAYRVSSLKKHCPAQGKELIGIYDRIVDIQHELMGLKKYNIRPKNHMFAREVQGGLFADGWGAGFAWDCMGELANPENIHKGIWCLAHEFGHVNQIRPGLQWVSTTEVTNNIYSVWTRYLLANDQMNLEQERVNDGDNNQVLGGRFNAYLNYGIVKGEHWLCQRGQDKMKDYENGGDHFVKLCPLWQLQLYYAVAGHGNYWNKADWFADVVQIVRNTDENSMNDGQLQLNFMRNVADAVREDLSDFFIKAGMLKPIDKFMDDYTPAQLTITRKECDELVQYMSHYPKPASPVIYYLSANSVRAYQQRLPVSGVYNQGITLGAGICTVAHKVWQNVTVFETYKDHQLTHVAMVGTDSPDKSTTLLRYPEGSTRIEAVDWNGNRTLVYGNR